MSMLSKLTFGLLGSTGPVLSFEDWVRSAFTFVDLQREMFFMGTAQSGLFHLDGIDYWVYAQLATGAQEWLVFQAISQHGNRRIVIADLHNDGCAPDLVPNQPGWWTICIESKSRDIQSEFAKLEELRDQIRAKI